ncbi:cytochrome c [Maliponia aquimaris]|uniref:Fructose dehydrogenase cytochrome subunit n=1 Tax=Maliponia aquimaris TaxID=1673631 RepID=A0A238KZU5_9RHOB|nr:cytochrome c [Maliponia aquimaris]SMX48343.1 Fructose dehydrogenase cytochrome subunit precursor [Maliponia aquimaris]
MRFFLKLVVLAAIVAAGIGLWVTAPDRVDPARFAGLTADTTRGQAVFTAAGCASCHHTKGDENKLVLTGGMEFVSDFGTFYAPNISPSPAGIGGWTFDDFANAVTRGVSPEGQHYYPAFPYTAYTKMKDQDVVDLWAYIQTLPPSDVASKPHDVGFPFNIRRSVGGWKFLFMSDAYVMDVPPDLERGRYLVEALAHCAECHTPRNPVGALDKSRWMGGAPNPSGKGTIPRLTPDKFDWSADDVAYYLETGFTPSFDAVGGHMAEVVENFSQLPAEDRRAVAAYVKALPALGN